MKPFYKICCCLFLILPELVIAQQLPTYSLYRENWGLINPAAASGDFFRYEYELSVGATHRRQWLGIKDGPVTQNVRAEYVLNTRKAYGVLGGLYLLNDQAGPVKQTGLHLRLAGMTLTDDPVLGALNVGLSFGLVQHRIQVEDLRAADLGDVKIGDPQLSMTPTISAGLFYYKDIGLGGYEKSFVFAGLSATQLMEQETDFPDEDLNIERVAHFHGLAGCYLAITDASYIETSVFVKYAENTPLNIDFNARYQLDKVFWFGGGFNTAKIFLLEAGLFFANIGSKDAAGLRIGYGYSGSFAEYGPNLGGSHEIGITYLFSPNAIGGRF